MAIRSPVINEKFSHFSVPQLLGTLALPAYLDRISGSGINELIIYIRNAETAKRSTAERWTSMGIQHIKVVWVSH